MMWVRAQGPLMALALAALGVVRDGDVLGLRRSGGRSTGDLDDGDGKLWRSSKRELLLRDV